MRESLIEKLRCPVDITLLSLKIISKDSDGHVIKGELISEGGNIYPIVDGVPNLIPDAEIRVENADLDDLQKSTIRSFGYEWRHFSKWGHLKEYPDVPNAEEKYRGGLWKNTVNAFWSKSLLDKGHLSAGKLVLDAGCGNGRFCAVTASTGAEVIGIDLGYGVISAFENTRHLENVHIVRGDLFRLPFPDGLFDISFSIGVLMHTGNASIVFDSIAKKVKSDGRIGVRVYGKGLWTYEFFDSLIRGITTRLSIPAQMRFAKFMAAISQYLLKKPVGRLRSKLYTILYRHIHLLPTVHHNFDWWSAPIATHHSVEEVVGWFNKNRINTESTTPDITDEKAKNNWRRKHGPISVMGVRGE